MSRLFIFCVIAICGTSPLAAQAARGKSSTVLIAVQDDAGNPIPEADVTVLRWTGEWKSIGVAGITDQRGEVSLDGLPTDQYLGLRVEAAGLAWTMHEVEFSQPEKRELVIKLAPPVAPVIQVFDPEGAPIVGAELQRIEIVDANNRSNYLTQRIAASLDIPMTHSDRDGRLRLPCLPAGSRLSLTIVHPDWKAVAVNNLAAADGEIGSATMQPGIRVRLELLPSAEVTESLDGLPARVKFFSNRAGSQEPVSIIHPFTIHDRHLDLTVYERDYSQLSVELDDYFVTPDLINAANSPVAQLDLSRGGSRTIQLNVRRKVQAKGKVVDQDGKGMKDVSLYGMIAATSKQWPPLNEDAGAIAKLRRNWGSAGSADTDSDGNYVISLAPGKATVEAIHKGYFANPYHIDFDVSDDGSTTIPTMTLLPVPTLRGVVRDELGREIKHAYVRMRSLGYGDADPVSLTRSDGSFELKLTRVPYAKGGGSLETSVYVVAVDPEKRLAGISQLDVTDTPATQDISVELSSKSSAWVLNPLAGLEEHDPDMARRERQRLAELQRSFPQGVVGQLAPDLAEGTWLNTNAKSLADLRGKIVLLDFWFIGCGPCRRDMPSIKAAHQSFAEQGFSVVAVHRKGQTPESVRAFAVANAMDYPIVVDDADGSITQAYQLLGVSGYPSYILLDREGRILHNDAVSPRPSLRQFKFERIYQALNP